jgi:hypothetical protein
MQGGIPFLSVHKIKFNLREPMENLLTDTHTVPHRHISHHPTLNIDTPYLRDMGSLYKASN